ncbi:arrestin domain-containing protein 1b [Callorhinchus milii]|uniref:Arrestin domain containing 1 n=1 Tax=Callorhinchus milii TaxID=7868 RepID=A0A4W3HVL2_CALMI|nr:arrestin domain-containing protein 1b [Callorhinchus milii]|eukprot:gi/632957350/ref/XP_007894429.1/ PREDICTED: arrestin domain-containing protein 1 [Callorhinchus milii]
MGKVQELSITLKNSKVVYGPGEFISGEVGFKLAAHLNFRAVKVNCIGSCGVSNKANDTVWQAEEQYFSSTLVVAEKASLSAGEYTYPFQFLLPATAPTSFEGPFGKISYRIRATVETPRFSKDYKAEKVFYILNLLNLNEINDIEQPNVMHVNKKFSYMLVKSGTASLTVSTDLKGYTSGQIIQLTTAIQNQSGKDLGNIVASLIQKATYKSKRAIYDLRTIAEVEGSGVKSWKQAEWREQIIVPPLPQSSLHGCNLIQIDYLIQVSIRSPEILVSLPIYIGNIAVNSPPLTPSRELQCASPLVVPTAPPVEDDSASGHQPMDRVVLPTKSHSQQQTSPHAFSYTSGMNLPDCESGTGGHLPGPMLCVSTGATVPYYADGPVVTVPSENTLILPPEYSSTWGYPYDPPPTYEESCSSANSSMSTGN